MDKKNSEMNYLSDEELNQLIADVESHELLKAPAYLKNDIMTQLKLEIEKDNHANTEREILERKVQSVKPLTTEATITPINLHKIVKRKLRIYELKVAAVAAAAIFALFLIPAGQMGNQGGMDSNTNSTANQPSVTQTINDRTNSFCYNIFEFSNGIINPQDTNEQ